MSLRKNNDIPTLRLSNSEHVFLPEKQSQKLIQTQKELNQRVVTDKQAERALQELVKIVDVEERKALNEYQQQIEQYEKEQKEAQQKRMELQQDTRDVLYLIISNLFIQVLRQQIREKSEKENKHREIELKFDDELKHVSDE